MASAHPSFQRPQPRRARLWLLIPALLCACLLLFPLFTHPAGLLQGVCIWLIALLLAAACLMAAWLIAHRKVPAERIFLVLAIGLGLFYLVAITPLSVPDEWTHLQTELRMASRLLRGDHLVDSTYVDLTGLTIHENSGSALLRLVGGLFTERPTGELVDLGENVGFFYPISYLPQALAAVVCMLLGLNGLWVFVLGSLCNLALYIALTYHAIRCIPRGKTLLLLLALLPMALQQAASLSYDAFLNGFSFLFIALVTRAALAQGPISRKELWSLAVTAWLLSPAKAVYAALLLLLVLIPGRRFSSVKQRIPVLAGIIGGAVVLTVLVQLGLFYGRLTGVDSSLGGSGPYTVAWAFSQPLAALRMLARTFAENHIFYLHTMVGSRLSGLTLDIPDRFITLFIFLLLLCALVGEKGEEPLRPLERLLYVLIPAVVVGAVLLTMLLAWTGSGDAVIQGVQGRYFLPVAPLLFLALSNRTVTAAKSLTALFAGVSLSLNVCCLLYILVQLAG